jgi:thiamine monophosphate kinase
MKETQLIWGECFVSLTFTVAVFWREILTVDVKVKKDYFEKLHVLYEVGLLLPSSSLSDVFAVGARASAVY